MLHGQSESMRIEDPGVVKAEFVVSSGGRRTLHQAKRSNPNGKWTLANLGSADSQLLQAIFDQLVGNDARFVFVSGSHAEELDTLTKRARNSESLPEFEFSFIGDAKHKTAFAQLREYWRATDSNTAYEVLRRITVRTASEEELREKVVWSLPSLFLAHPDDVAAALISIVQDAVHKTITRNGLIDSLAEKGYVLRSLRHVKDAAALVDTKTHEYLVSVRRKLIGGTLIPREATKKLLERIGSKVASETVFTGKAGCGKTGCVIELVDEALRQDMAVLAFRLDLLDPVKSTVELGRELGLEESPVLVLEGAAAGRPALLVVDQLDAVSVVSGRGSAFLDAVRGLLEEAQGLRARIQLHVVVVCRHFDWENDPSLRSIVTKQHAKVEVAELSIAETTDVLTGAGFQVRLFESRQIELLRLPQNLSLFLEAGFEPETAPRFNTVKELFVRYRAEKRARVNERIRPVPDQWEEVIRLLCDQMTQTQQLSVMREVLDPHEQYAACMASDGVLTLDGRRYGFGHESFFDYCFARAFVVRKESLVEFLIKSVQHLFRRAQVRQVLAYLRDDDRDRYCLELRALLSDKRVRPHLKELSLALVAAVPDPGEDEWEILEPWVQSELATIERGEKNTDRLASLVWQHLFRADGWFTFLDAHGLVAGWLASDVNTLANMGVHYLRSHAEQVPDRVAELLEPYCGVGAKWNDRLRYVMQWADHDKSRRLFELLLRLIDDGTLDEARGPIAVNSTFWCMFHSMGETQPVWVGELLAHWMRRRRVLIGSMPDEDGSIPWGKLFNHDNFGCDVISQAAEGAPFAFVTHVMPVVLDLSAEATLVEDSDHPRRDSIWPFLMKTEHESVDSAVITALAYALRRCAEDPGTDLSAVLRSLRSQKTFIANVLLLVLYTHGPDRFADEAAKLLCEEPWRFHCGYTDSPYWISMELIRAIVPHCIEETRSRLESVVLAYAPEFERSAEGRGSFGRTRFSFLSCFERVQLSSLAQTRLGELERKFGEPESGPEGMQSFFVGSPIKKEAAEQMTDAQWLRAIAKYDTEDRPDRWKSPEKGGAMHLAAMLGDFTKSEPERFARLCLRLPATTNSVYFARVLDGLKEAEAITTLKLDVCRKVFSERREECGKPLADLLGSVEDTLPDDAVDILNWLATEHPDPLVSVTGDGDGELDNSGHSDKYTRGINSVRGRAAEAIFKLVWRDAGYIERFRNAIEHLADDRSVAVRSCVASLVYALTSHDYSWALTLFGNLVRVDERILQAPRVDQFLHYGVRHHFADVRDFVSLMLRSDEAKVAEVGARLAALAVLYANPAEGLVAEALQGGAAQRLGIVQVAAQNIAADDCRQWCEEQLLLLFDDPDVAVRREAGTCFQQLIDSPLESYERLIQAFCDSAAYADDSYAILHLLEKSAHRLPGLTCGVGEKFLDRFTDEAKDISTHRAAEIHTVAALIFRTYQQHQSDAWASRCLDLIDRMCIEGITDVRKGLSLFDR